MLMITPSCNIRYTDDEKSALFKRLDPVGAGVSCNDLVDFLEEPEDDNMMLTIAASTHSEGSEGKLLRRAQATVVEAAQVLIHKYCPQKDGVGPSVQAPDDGRIPFRQCDFEHGRLYLCNFVIS